MFSDAEFRDSECMERVLESKKNSIKDLKKEIECITAEIHENRITRKVNSELYECKRKDLICKYVTPGNDTEDMEKIVEEKKLSDMKVEIDKITQTITTLRLKRKSKTLVVTAMEENLISIQKQYQDKQQQKQQQKVQNKHLTAYKKLQEKTCPLSSVSLLTEERGKVERLEIEVGYLKEEKTLLLEQIQAIQDRYKSAKVMLDMKEQKLEETAHAISEIEKVKLQLIELQNKSEIDERTKTQLSQKLIKAERLLEDLGDNQTKLENMQDGQPSLDKTLADLTSRLKKLEIRLEKTTKEKNSYYKILYRTKTEKSDLTEQLKVANNENEKLQNQVGVLADEKKNLLHQLDTTKQDKYAYERITRMKMTKERNSAEQEEQTRVMEDMKNSLKCQQERLLEVSKENEDLANQVGNLTQKKRELTEKNKNLQQDLNVTVKNLEMSNQRTLDALSKAEELEQYKYCMKDSLSNLDNETENKCVLKQQNTQLMSKIEETRKQNDTEKMKIEVNTLKKSLHEKCQENERLECSFNETDRLKDDISTMHVQLEMFSKEKWLLQDENDKLLDEVKELSQRNKEIVDENEKLKTKVDELSSETKTMTTENKYLTSKLEYLKKERKGDFNKKTDTGSQIVMKENESLQKTVEELERNLQSKEVEKINLESTISKLEQQNTELQNSSKELNQSLKTKKNIRFEYQRLRFSIDELSIKLQDKTKECKATEVELSQAREKKMRIENHLDETGELNQQLKKQVQELRKNFENMKQENIELVKDLQKQMDKNSRLNDRLQHESDNVQEKACSYQEYNDLKETIQHLHQTVEMIETDRDGLNRQVYLIQDENTKLKIKLREKDDKQACRKRNIETLKKTKVEKDKLNAIKKGNRGKTDSDRDSKEDMSGDEELEPTGSRICTLKPKKNESGLLQHLSDWDSNSSKADDEHETDDITHSPRVSKHQQPISHVPFDDPTNIVTTSPRTDKIAPFSSNETLNFSKNLSREDTSSPLRESHTKEKRHLNTSAYNTSFTSTSEKYLPSTVVKSELQFNGRRDTNYKDHAVDDLDVTVDFDDVNMTTLDDDTVNFDDDDDNQSEADINDLLSGLDEIEAKKSSSLMKKGSSVHKLLAEQIKTDFNRQNL